MPVPNNAHADSDGMVPLARVEGRRFGGTVTGTAMDAFFRPGMIRRDPGRAGSGIRARCRTRPDRARPAIPFPRNRRHGVTEQQEPGIATIMAAGPVAWWMPGASPSQAAGRIVGIFSIANSHGMLVPVRVVSPDTLPAQPSRRQSEDRAINARQPP